MFHFFIQSNSHLHPDPWTLYTWKLIFENIFQAFYCFEIKNNFFSIFVFSKSRAYQSNRNLTLTQSHLHVHTRLGKGLRNSFGNLVTQFSRSSYLKHDFAFVHRSPTKGHQLQHFEREKACDTSTLVSIASTLLLVRTAESPIINCSSPSKSTHNFFAKNTIKRWTRNVRPGHSRLKDQQNSLHNEFGTIFEEI